MLEAAALSAETLAHAFDQSVDCVKLIAPDGRILWMNANGVCAMEIEDTCAVFGAMWAELWPEDSRQLVTDSLSAAKNGDTVRFDAFCPTAKGTPRWWNVTVSRVTDIHGAPAGFLAVSRDITTAEKRREALVVASEEMRHRLKNTYAMIGSLLIGFARGNEELQQFAQDMQARLISLSTAQSLFAAPEVPREMQLLIPALVEPFATSACLVTTEIIADVTISTGYADAIALVLGELAVNSAKHGAIGAGGKIAVRAEILDGDLRVMWTETSINPVIAHSRPDGQGLKLIDRIVRARDGSLDIDWQSHGPLVTLRFPHDRAGSPSALAN